MATKNNMTKQEEIDWGIRSFLCDAFNCDEDHYLAVKSLELRQYLAREGVVIKVDGAISIVFNTEDPATYVAVEPLADNE